MKLNGQYIMYVSEGCGGVQHVGYSDDTLTWRFDPQPFLDVSEFGTLYEVACAAADCGAGDDALLPDFCYRKPDGKHGGRQAIFSRKEPFRHLQLHLGASLNWGALLRYQGKMSFAQGWDTADGTEIMYCYLRYATFHIGRTAHPAPAKTSNLRNLPQVACLDLIRLSRV